MKARSRGYAEWTAGVVGSDSRHRTRGRQTTRVKEERLLIRYDTNLNFGSEPESPSLSPSQGLSLEDASSTVAGGSKV